MSPALSTGLANGRHVLNEYCTVPKFNEYWTVPKFAATETITQTSEVTCLKSHSQLMRKLGLDPSPADANQCLPLCGDVSQTNLFPTEKPKKIPNSIALQQLLQKKRYYYCYYYYYYYY